MLPRLDLALALLVALAVVAVAALRLRAAARLDRRGRLVAVDTGNLRPLRSERYRIAGRPDEIRARADGRWVPVEWKTRAAPRGGPLPSHRMQLLAYCLLCEEATGRAPPYGLLRYGDGTEFRVPWDRAARAELLRLRAELARPYDGRSAGSVAKCAGCRFRAICDVRVG